MLSNHATTTATTKHVLQWSCAVVDGLWAELFGPQQSSSPCQCSTLTGGGIGCCQCASANQPMYAPSAAAMQQITPAPVMQQSLCPNGVAPLCSCSQQNQCQQMGCACSQLSSGGSGCCPQSYMPNTQSMQPISYQQPLCPGTNQMPVSQCAAGMCPQFDCRCQQLSNGQNGCCQTAATAIAQPMPVFAQPVLSSCPNNAQPMGYCNYQQQQWCNPPNTQCNTQTNMCCPVQINNYSNYHMGGSSSNNNMQYGSQPYMGYRQRLMG